MRLLFEQLPTQLLDKDKILKHDFQEHISGDKFTVKYIFFQHSVVLFRIQMECECLEARSVSPFYHRSCYTPLSLHTLSAQPLRYQNQASHALASLAHVPTTCPSFSPLHHTGFLLVLLVLCKPRSLFCWASSEYAIYSICDPLYLFNVAPLQISCFFSLLTFLIMPNPPSQALLAPWNYFTFFVCCLVGVHFPQLKYKLHGIGSRSVLPSVAFTVPSTELGSGQVLNNYLLNEGIKLISEG